jgi:hypothetical protein
MDDSNERIFEVTVAAEMLRSIISVSFAAVVADFVLAEHETLCAVADPRICRVVRKLRELSQAATVKARSDAAARLQSIAEQESRLLNKAAPVADVPAATAGAAAEVEVTWSITGKSAEAAVSEGEAATTDAAEGATVMEVDGEAAVKVEPSASDGDVEQPKVLEQKPGQEQAQSEQAQQEEAQGNQEPIQDASHEEEAAAAVPEVAVSDAEALEWRAHFHAACRWFDTEQDKFLRADHLQLILQSSPREVSRADLSSAVWRVCKEQERLRYDSFI